MRRFRFLILLAGVTMTIVGIVGLVAHLGSVSASTRVVTTQTHPPPAQTTPRAQDFTSFFTSFSDAIRTGDTAFLTARLDPAVLQRYGSKACRRAVPRLKDPTQSLRLVKVSGPIDYAYTSDGKTTSVPNTYVFHVTGTASGKTVTADYHFALVGGKLNLFLDCGTPLPPQ